LLQDRDLTLHAWGVNNPATPALHRAALRVLFPLQARMIRFTFKIDDTNYAKAVGRIEQLLGEVNAALEDGRKSILGGDEQNYTDLAFAAFTGLWLMPEAYGGGKADAVRIDRDKASAAMQADTDRWIEAYPRAVSYVETLYENRGHA